jgi:sialidase-1
VAVAKNGFSDALVGATNQMVLVSALDSATFSGLMMILRTAFIFLSIAASAGAMESFEALPAGPVDGRVSSYGRFWDIAGHASVIAGKGRTGKHALHLTGGDGRSVTMVLDGATREKRSLDFHAERWTVRGGFEFQVEAKVGNEWSVLKREDAVRVGDYHTRVRAVVPAGAEALRFSCTSDGGVLIDDLSLARTGPMTVSGLEIVRPVLPILRRKLINPATGFSLTTDGDEKPVVMESVAISLEGTSRPQDIERIELVPGTGDPGGAFGGPLAVANRISNEMVMTPDKPLEPGVNWFWISVVLKDDADIDGRIAVALRRVVAGGRVFAAKDAGPATPLRIGVGLRLRGDDGSDSYRIPGLATTKKGTMIAVYDVRHKHCGDLPARIDVGVSRGLDGGQRWEDMRIAMSPQTMGDVYQSDGVGDPAVLVDEVTGRIWIAAFWSHGDHAWNSSGPGLSPDETGQLLLAHSDDDGVTWSPLRNITAALKDPAWRLMFNGPGAGICMKDGTLVFPAQFRAADGGETQGKPFSTIISSRDRGATWVIGSGAKIDTTEAQVVELEDGALMLNCRDNRGGSRSVMVTRDLGKTWRPHATDRKALPEPVCMASLLRWDHPRHGTLFVFSNPATTRGRHNMTLKFSKDNALTWPEKWHMLYDSRGGSGYSCLAPSGENHVGVLYEGPCELYYLRVPLDDCLK